MHLNQPSSENLQNSLGSEKIPKQSSTDTTQWIPILIFPLDVFSQQRSDVNFNREKRSNQSSPMKSAVVVQSPSHVLLFETPWTATHQASLSLPNSQSLPKFPSFASVMPSSLLILGCSLLLPSIFQASESFPMSLLFTSGNQNTGASVSASV